MLDWCLQLKIKYVLVLASALFLSYYFFGLFTTELVPQWHIALATSRFYPVQVQSVDKDTMKLYAVGDDDHFYHFLISVSRRPTAELLPEILPVHALALPSHISKVKAFDVKLIKNMQFLIVLCENASIFSLDERFNVLWQSVALRDSSEAAGSEEVEAGFVRFLPSCLSPTSCNVVLIGAAMKKRPDLDGSHSHGDGGSRDFSTLAFEAETGKMVWQHLPRDTGRELENENERLAPSVRHHWKLKLLRSHLKHEHIDDRPWVTFRSFFMRQLPHSWVSPHDTLASLAALTHQRASLPPPSTKDETVSRPNVLVIRHERGLVLLDLFTGRQRSHLEMEGGPGKAFYKDASRLNLALFEAHLNETTGVTCSLRLVPRSSGIVEQDSARTLHRWDSACAPVGLFDSPRPAHHHYREDERKLVAPLVVDRADISSGLFSFLWRSRQLKDVISLASDGILSSFSTGGYENWRVRLPVSWLSLSRDISSGELASGDVRQRYEHLFVPSLSRLFPSQNSWGLQAVIATGWDGLAIAELSTGRLVASHELPCQPIQRPIVANDHVIVVCHSMILGFSMTFGIRLLTFLAAIVTFGLTALFLVCCLDPKSLFWDLID